MDRLCTNYDKTETVLSSYGIITRDSSICTAYGHIGMKYTYMDTTRQINRLIGSSYNNWEAFLS